MKTLRHLVTAALASLIWTTVVNCPRFAHAETSTTTLFPESSQPASDAQWQSASEWPQNSSPFSVLACLAEPENMLAFWPAERNFDDIINCNTGTRRGGVSFAAGEVGNAFVFNGTDSAIEIGPALNMGLSDFTLEAWINGDTAMNSWGRIFDKGFATAFCFGRVSTSNKVGFEYLNTGSQGNGFSTISDVIDGTWHHVAVVKEYAPATDCGGGMFADYKATLYADGVAENWECVGNVPASNTLPLLIGWNPGEGTRGHWKGSIDEPTIYTRALSADEIAAIVAAGSAGKCRVGPLTLTSAVSRKTHGAAGDFDIPLALCPTGAGTVEPRVDGPTTIVFTFNHDIAAADGDFNCSEVTVTGADCIGAGASANRLRVHLRAVVDQSIVHVTLNGITDLAGHPLTGDNDVEIRALVGDINQNRNVYNNDYLILHNHDGEGTNPGNFLADLDLNGAVEATSCFVGDCAVLYDHFGNHVP